MACGFHGGNRLKLMKKKIAIFYGGPSSEHNVSINSAKTIYKFLNKKKYKIAVCYISKTLTAKIVTEDNPTFEKINATIPLLEVLETIKKENYFALLAGIHGEFVEDGKLQSLLEYFNIPYSGSDSKSSALSMDKYRSMLLVNTLSPIELPETFIVSSQNIYPKVFKFPVIIKPNTLGSSVGISIVKTPQELKKVIADLKKRYPSQELLIQELIQDSVELSCGVLQKKNGEFLLLPPIEIIPKRNNFFDYDSKYLVGGSEEITPPISIDKNMSDKISSLSTKIHTLLGLKTFSRSDFLIKKGTIYYLETNTLPGMTATSLLPQEAAAAGISYTKLLDFIIENSYE